MTCLRLRVLVGQEKKVACHREKCCATVRQRPKVAEWRDLVAVPQGWRGSG